MMRLIAESPLIVAVVLGVLAAALIYGWLQTGRKPLAIIGLIVACLIPIAWIVSENWVTDREQIEQLIYQTADAVEANDYERAVAVIGDEATRQQALNELPQWEFSQADVGRIQSIRLIDDTLPMQADVDMTVKVEVSSKRGGLQQLRVPRRLLLTLEKRADNADQVGGGWVVTKYEHMSIVGGPDNFSTQPK
ncbi:hypothetical protein [Allorhodopirellula heiligendammensis]|uniref:Tim44-like domain protein n=1 Tax=Allorhodopirellula heiligendammensis TaxID=2714739 RepID=A0A5C6C4P1_9BACT|nr:hypothetical protein [Allorhodopirellula heiligendammensis]TWU19075.1 hypothetical protein Poly21_12460 [Allorhodopirellula heiligendammensis]